MNIKSLYRIDFISINPYTPAVTIYVMAYTYENIESIAWKKFIEKYGEYSVSDYELFDISYLGAGLMKGGFIL